MANIASIRCGFYRISFELITVRLTDADGAEGVGYTFTAGRNGAAVHAILNREIAELFGGDEADEFERIWRKAWWALHYGGRGGPTVLAISAFDMALWDLKAKRAQAGSTTLILPLSSEDGPEF
jgi:L-alanine-DL-glutamate epimerase-like enolase superfamily enzyme